MKTSAIVFVLAAVFAAVNANTTAPTTEVSRQEEVLIPAICSMRYCTLNGARAFCVVPSTRTGPVFTTCGKWSITPESKKQCDFACPEFCLPEEEQPVASNGQKFCNECILRQASCESGYQIFGPVRPRVTPRPTIRPPIPVIQKCSVKLCSLKGSSSKCLFERRLITCAKWANTKEKKEQCNFFCPLFCLPEGQQPKDNFGNKYCNICLLQQASCQSNFKKFGPVQDVCANC